MAKAFFATALILIFMIGFVVYRTGLYKEVTIGSGHQGPFLLVYKVHRGPYHKIVPVIESVETFFKDRGVLCPLSFGRYLHDPNLVEQDRLESHGGCAFSKSSETLMESIEDSGFQIDKLEKREYLVAGFGGSPSMGPFKVYPKMKAWLEKYGYKMDGPVIELYQIQGEDAVFTRYLFPYR